MGHIHEWADPQQVAEAVADVAQLGPYFALHGDAPVAALSLERMCEPQSLHALLRAVGNQIGSDEGRVAASTLQYGFAARCWSVVLGVWHRTRLVLDVRDISFVVVGQGSIQLSINELRAWDCRFVPLDEVAELIAEVVNAHALIGMHAALRRVVRIADGLLWGNAASALASVPLVIVGNHADDQIAALTSAILSRAPLTDRLVTTSGGGVLRRSCCLWYRTRDRDHCADCPLTDRPMLRQIDRRLS